MPFGFSGSLGFGQKKGSGSSSSTSTSTGTERSLVDIQRLDASQMQQLNELLGLFTGELGGETDFTRDAALRDVRGMVDSVFREYQQEYVPQILGAQSGSGSFGTSAGQQLADRGYADAVARGTELQLGAISQYAQLAQAERGLSLTGLQAALQGLLQGREVTDSTSDIDITTTTSGKSKSKETGFNLGLGGSFSPLG